MRIDEPWDRVKRIAELRGDTMNDIVTAALYAYEEQWGHLLDEQRAA